MDQEKLTAAMGRLYADAGALNLAGLAVLAAAPRPDEALEKALNGLALALGDLLPHLRQLDDLLGLEDYIRRREIAGMLEVMAEGLGRKPDPVDVEQP